MTRRNQASGTSAVATVAQFACARHRLLCEIASHINTTQHGDSHRHEQRVLLPEQLLERQLHHHAHTTYDEADTHTVYPMATEPVAPPTLIRRSRTAMSPLGPPEHLAAHNLTGLALPVSRYRP